MDWFSILLILFFIVLPLLQQVVGAARRGEAPSDEAEPDFEVEEGGRAPGRVAAPAEPSAKSGDGWSEGWVPWPSPVEERPEIPEDLAAPEVFREPRSREALPRSEPEPAAPERTSPAMSPPSALPSALRPAPRPRVSAERAARVSRRADAPTVAAVGTRTTHPYGLADPAELRRAIVLAEIVGPPISLRPSERGAGDS